MRETGNRLNRSFDGQTVGKIRIERFDNVNIDTIVKQAEAKRANNT